MKRLPWVFSGCLFVALLLAALGVGVLYLIPALGEFPGGMPGSYGAVDYDPRLTREASTATVVIDALNRYHSKHSVFPAAASQLSLYLSSASDTSASLQHSYICGWYYSKMDNGKSYVISRKLGWDPCLKYEYRGSTGRWIFEPGDGSPSKPIILKR